MDDSVSSTSGAERAHYTAQVKVLKDKINALNLVVMKWAIEVDTEIVFDSEPTLVVTAKCGNKQVRRQFNWADAVYFVDDPLTLATSLSHFITGELTQQILAGELTPKLAKSLRNLQMMKNK